ncbi:uncharacterized protein [Typha latifolia]|uniref:uncharacterized protein isoform X2 n=1 Tax=Typha latifolia TaxID=4733 RepID=UPI003C2BA0E6
MPTVVEGRKRDASVFVDDLILSPLPLSKRIRSSPGGDEDSAHSSAPLPLNPPTTTDAFGSGCGGREETPLGCLRLVFPDVPPQVLEKVLEASGNDLDYAIKGINKLQSGSEGRDLGLTTSKYLPDNGTNVTVSLEADYDGGMAAHTSLTESIPTDGSGWVDLFVREISTASNLADARHRAFKLLEILEKSIVVHTGSGSAESFHKENKKLEEQVEALLRENSVLKRAVAIQHERQKDYDEKSQQLQHLKQTVFQYQEQIRTLEVNNYALTMHMYRAQQNSPISGHFHPDVF